MDSGELKVMGNSPTVIVGDVIEEEIRLTWSKDNMEEISLAKKIFKEYLEKGWLAVGEGGDRKMQVFSFNPDLDRITLSPLALGG